MTNPNETIMIFFNNEIVPLKKSEYGINNGSNGQYDLIIYFVDRTHAGRYWCKRLDSKIESAAYVTVIESDPICEFNATRTPDRLTENDRVPMYCEVNSTGFLIPVMKWTKDHKVIESFTKNKSAIDGSMTTISYITLQLQPQDNNVTITCTTTFQWPNGSLQNLPGYVHVWKHTIATVLYGVRNITIRSRIERFQYGDQITCLADGNPKPTYTWTHTSADGKQHNGSVLTLSHSLSVGTSHTFECTAQNTVNSETKNLSLSVSVFISETSTVGGGLSDGNSHFETRIAVGFAGFASIVIVLIIIPCILYRQKTKSWLITRFSSLRRKLNHDPDVLSRESRQVTVSFRRGIEREAVFSEESVYVIQCSDVYAEIRDWPYSLQENDELAPGGVPPLTTGKEHLVGADGTEYQDFSGATRDGTYHARSRSPVFTQVESYAYIDHSQRVPLPPENISY